MAVGEVIGKAGMTGLVLFVHSAWV